MLRDLAAGEAVSVRVVGGCMEPLLARGEAIRVERRRRYWPGDVLVFRSPAGDLTAHRVLGWRPAGIVTQGDGCDVHDAPVSRDAVIGAVAGVRIRRRSRVWAAARFARIVMRRIAR
jgi:signal peptidase I